MTMLSFLMPEAASTQAAQTDLIYYLLLWVSALIIVTVLILVIGFSIRYRRGSKAPRGPLPAFFSREFEIGWTSATLISGPVPFLVGGVKPALGAGRPERRTRDPCRRQTMDVEDPARQRRARNQRTARRRSTRRYGWS